MAFAGIGDRVEGIHAVGAAVAAGRVTDIWSLPAVAKRHGTMLEAARRRGGRVHLTNDIAALAVTDAHQGIVAHAVPLRTRSPSDLVADHDRPAVVVLDHLQDPYNVGSIVRTAAAAGMSGVVVANRRAARLGAAAFKAAAGAFEWVPVAVVSSVSAALAELKELGLWVVGLTAQSGTSLLGLELLTEPVALVVGAEGGGLSRLVSQRADVLASLPMAEQSESLNASVAAALAMYEIMRTRSA